MRKGNLIRAALALCLGVTILGAAYAADVQVLKSWKIDSLDEVLTKSGVEIDKAVSSDGNGSLKVVATGPTTIRLFETGPMDVDNARLTYSARLRTQDVKGKVFLEMWCGFTGKGEYFSRGLQNPLTGTVDWTSAETPFFLQAGQKPDMVKLNVVVDGSGTVWIDDVKLMKGPLK
jgi:hypothetical protein